MRYLFNHAMRCPTTMRSLASSLFSAFCSGVSCDAPRKLDRQLRYKPGAKGEPDELADTQNLQPGIQSESGVGSLQGTTHDQRNQ
jgi:hypothetical protein